MQQIAEQAAVAPPIIKPYTIGFAIPRGLKLFCVFNFGNLKGRKFNVNFDGGNISSDGGILPLAELDRRLNLTSDGRGAGIRRIRYASEGQG